MSGVDDRDPGEAVDVFAPFGVDHRRAVRLFDHDRLHGFDEAGHHILVVLLDNLVHVRSLFR